MNGGPHMSKKAKIPAACCALVLLLCLALSQLTPEKRVARYVASHQTELQSSMDAYFDQGRPLSYDSAIPAVNHWPGQHPMVEYILLTGFGYYGFYYSPDDVSLAFQNVPVPLEESSNGWQWQAEGDDRGSTHRLSPGWFYFEAHF